MFWKLRVCVNLKKVNATTIRDNYSLPITDHVLDRVAKKQAYSFLDGFLGYNQLAIALEDQHKMAFAQSGESMHTESCLLKVSEKCRTYRICLNPNKCVFMVRQGKILRHIVFENGISTDLGKIKVIVEMPRPINAKQIQCFMGHCGYYKRFIYMYAIIAQPLYRLIVKFGWTDQCEESFIELQNALIFALVLKALYRLIVVFGWTGQCEESFIKLQNALIFAPVLKAPDWENLFYVHIDASAFAIGCILAQPGDGNMDFPVCYVSRQLNNAKNNYTTTE
ncbi:hypothetical protein L7F22_038281 [Adiantum nelumboides]|nr:hypothetical protein [Adiantum nelumboides]